MKILSTCIYKIFIGSLLQISHYDYTENLQAKYINSLFQVKYVCVYIYIDVVSSHRFTFRHLKVKSLGVINMLNFIIKTTDKYSRIT